MAQVDYFLKLDGIDGESTDAKHKGEIDVMSWSWGETNAGTHGVGGGGGAGKVVMQDIHFVAKMSKASPKLFLHCANGQHIKEATLVCRKAGKDQQEYLIVKLNDVIITGVTHGGSAGGPATENVSLAFAKVDLEYKPQRPDGSLDAGVSFKYDIKANKII